MTSMHSRPRSHGNAQLLIDQPELRSILSSLSHELSRPLMSLRAGFDLLLAEPPQTFSPDQRGHLLTMVTLCDDILQLTRSYLDYAGIVQGSRPFCYGSFTIGALIEEINRQFAPIASARFINWQWRAEPPELAVVSDASRCQQIFGNIVANALKYTPMGGSVRISACGDSEGWSVTVSDTGPGIPREAREQVFEPFYRLAREEHSGIEGSGLGLAICRELVHQLQGEITLESDLGSGTAVSVRFPASAQQANRPAWDDAPNQLAGKAGKPPRSNAP
jgi:signal transduction histidine kinase